MDAIGNTDDSDEYMSGLMGRLEWAGLLQDGSPNPAGPSFQEALRDRLGLKLQQDKGPVEILVIDHIEHPSEN